MAIAGAVIVPVRQDLTDAVIGRLRGVPEAEVQAVGPKGIAIVLEAGTSELRRISERIVSWEEVLEFELASLNWESET